MHLQASAHVLFEIQGEGRETDYLSARFAEYYSKNPVAAPPSPEKREFGFGSWDNKIGYRHFEFRTEQELNRYVTSSAPAYVSYSSAYYQFPAARPMEKKEWLGGDLVFDIDADELRQEKGQECTHAAGWVCEKCMGRAKEETSRLVEEFLVPDFGFKKGDIRVFFSGNRGYHVHVAGAEVYTLDKQARKEMIDYMTGAELDADAVWDNLLRRRMGGWASRAGRAWRAEIEESGSPDKARLLEDMDAGRWDNQKGAKQKLKSLMEKKRLHLGSEFDKSVTLDTSKLIRLPTTLHGGTGLLCRELKSLDSFDPFADPVVFSDNPVKIIADKDTPPFVLKGQSFEPKGLVELPEYAAIYLLCKKRATVMQ